MMKMKRLFMVLTLLIAVVGSTKAEEYPALKYGVAAMKADLGRVLCTDGNIGSTGIVRGWS